MSSYAPYAPRHTIEPELLTPHLPRSAHFTSRTLWIRRFCLNLLIGAVLFCIYRATLDMNDLRALMTRGAEIQAKIVDMHETHGKSTTYYLDYDYYAGGEYVSGRQTVSRDEYESTNINDSRTVTYLPEAPQTHRVGEVNDERIAHQRNNWILGTLLGTLTLGGFLAWAEFDFRKHLYLLREGLPVIGRMISHKIVRNKTTTYYLTYHFDLTDSIGFTRQVSVSKNLYDRYTLGEPEMTILYDPKNPKRNLPYFLAASARLDTL